MPQALSQDPTHGRGVVLHNVRGVDRRFFWAGRRAARICHQLRSFARRAYTVPFERGTRQCRGFEALFVFQWSLVGSLGASQRTVQAFIYRILASPTLVACKPRGETGSTPFTTAVPPASSPRRELLVAWRRITSPWTVPSAGSPCREHPVTGGSRRLRRTRMRRGGGGGVGG